MEIPVTCWVECLVMLLFLVMYQMDVVLALLKADRTPNQAAGRVGCPAGPPLSP